MQIFGWELRRVDKAAPMMHPVDARGGWFPIVREPFTGAWQKNQEIKVDTALSFSAVYACVRLIASDISKLDLRLLGRDSDGIWQEVENPAYSPVLRKPNRWQNPIQFLECWVQSKLINGNTYVLKARDGRGVVTGLYVLDPNRTKVLVAPDGEIFYELRRDNLSGIEDESVTVPASEIIHDRSALYHPLCGVSPIMAAASAIVGGSAMQRNSALFFQNGSRPGGLLVAPGVINDADVERIRSLWENKYSGDNIGRIAVVGSGLKYESLALSASDSQLIESLQWSAQTVCSCFQVPAYKIGVGEMPKYDNIEALNLEYFNQCLQNHMQCIERGLSDGLGLDKSLRVDLDQSGLLRMDTVAKTKAWGDLRKGGIATPNEARAAFEMPPLTGGDDVYMQEQEFGLAAHARRNLMPDPFGTAQTAPPPAQSDTAARSVDFEALEKMTEAFVADFKLKEQAAGGRNKTR